MKAEAHDPQQRIVGPDPVPSYAPRGSNPDPVLQTAMEMLRANREREAEQAGSLHPPGRTHTNMRLLGGYIYLISPGAGMEDGAASGQPNVDGPGPLYF